MKLSKFLTTLGLTTVLSVSGTNIVPFISTSSLFDISPAEAAVTVSNDYVWLDMPQTGNQNDNWSCGPTSAARVINFYGHNVNRSTLVNSVNRKFILPPKIKKPWGGHWDIRTGTTPHVLRDVIKKWEGNNVKLERKADFNKLLGLLRQGKPVVALLRVGSMKPGDGIVGTWPEMHWVVIHGFSNSKQEIYYTETNDGGTYKYSFSEFKRKWDWNVGDGLANESIQANGVKARTMIWVDRVPPVVAQSETPPKEIILVSGNGDSNPSYIIETPGQPAVAVFENRRESFALGCPEIRDAWGVTDRRGVSPSEFNRILNDNPVVADLPCNGSIQHIKLSDEGPNLLWIRHRNGKLYRHYINSTKFPNALRSGSIQYNDGPSFRATYPDRGNDFKEINP